MFCFHWALFSYDSVSAVLNLLRVTDHLVNFDSVHRPPRLSRAKVGPGAEKLSISPAKFPNDLDLFLVNYTKLLFLQLHLNLYSKISKLHQITYRYLAISLFTQFWAHLVAFFWLKWKQFNKFQTFFFLYIFSLKSYICYTLFVDHQAHGCGPPMVHGPQVENRWSICCGTYCTCDVGVDLAYLQAFQGLSKK